LIDTADALLLEVVARELADMAKGAGKVLVPLGMAAALIRTIDTGAVFAAPAQDRQIDAPSLTSYLIARGVVAAGAKLALQRSALGYSKDTYLISVDEPGADPRSIVIRRDLPAGPSRTTVVDEFPLVSCLFERSFPIAEPLMLEADRSVLGQAFMIARGAPGAPDLESWETATDRRRSCAADLAAFLGRLHRVRADDVPIRRSGKAGEDELDAYFREWRGYWRECGPADLPVIDRAFDLMQRRLPKGQPLAVVHSDVGFQNILVEEGRIQAVLDWEFSHLGEPEEDLAYCRPTVEALTAWDDFLALYRRAGGPPVRPERLRDYQLWRGVRNATCCALGLRAFNSGLNTDLRLAFAGRVLLGEFAADVRRQMALLFPEEAAA
jgi:aminoglycoside phosphotransferase (APT) family kinase protein